MSVGEDSNEIVMELLWNRDGIVTESTDTRRNQGFSFFRFPNPNQHEHLTSDISQGYDKLSGKDGPPTVILSSK